MYGRLKSRRVAPSLIAFCSAVAALSMTGDGAATTSQPAALRISAIRAHFEESDRATYYRVDVADDDPKADITYRWTLSLEAVDPTKPVDPDCNNHGMLTDDDTSFVWHHGNKGDPIHDDGCDHSKMGAYGHQGLVTVVVTDDHGNTCTATYKGTNSSPPGGDPAVASVPVCGRERPKQPNCKCRALALQIVPKSVEIHYDAGSDTRPESETLTFTVAWTLNCDKGKGDCNATAKLLADSPWGQRLTFHCAGQCSASQHGTAPVRFYRIDIHPGDLRGAVVRINVRRQCQGRQLARTYFALAFSGNGERVDLKRSKLK